MAENWAARNRARRPREGAFGPARSGRALWGQSLARRARASLRRMCSLVLTFIFTMALDPRSGGLISPACAGPAPVRVTQAAPSAPAPAPSTGVAIPGFHGPPPGFDGTSASGPVRAEPAHMPFYVATRGTTTIYLLGTLHVGDPYDYPKNQPFRRPILAALAASPTLALEISPDDLLRSQDDVSKYGVCSYACLPRLLPDSIMRKLAFRLRGNPAALEEIKKTRPWLAALLVETYDSLAAGLQTEYGTEAQLENVYLPTRGKVVGLETLAEQMRSFTNLTLAEQREMLAQDLAQTPAQNMDDVKTLHRLWRIGDADAISAWATAKSERLARTASVARALDNRIVFDRNRRFAARMVAIAAPNRPIFVAIGSLHLGGPRGVLALLRQRGFTVEAG
ncbi:TraB/GumN family protein [Trinickia dabaoshanensis]|uniref:TraB/GumN family protein n=1 Tax=Trinickia dabaoshanensis TaxID=564714 RepID=A0A2N7VSF7_9BURK|nr:TraB/GumN family protein [Trinickia dabaoshanensis]PMS20087.1 TraB/GumN family protein [Trinickia dabaoshanensis]